MVGARRLASSSSDSKLVRPSSHVGPRASSSPSIGTSNRPASRSGSRTACRPGSRAGGMRSAPAQLFAATAPVRSRHVWSHEQLAEQPEPSEDDRHDRGVSWPAKRENRAKEMFTSQLDTSQELAKTKESNGEHGSTQHELESPGAAKENIEVIAAALKEEVGAIDRRIEELSKSLLMGNLLSDEEAVARKDREERDARKREREAELRKARMKEKAARDPHRKVQLRLENKRRFEMDTLDDTRVPTTKIDFHSLSGRDQLRMVDVRAIRSKCQGLNERIFSVPKLVALQRDRERECGATTSAFGSSLPTFLSTSTFSMFSEDTLLPSQLTWEEKNERARLQRQCNASESIVRKLNDMKYPPERLTQSYDVFEWCDPDTRGDWQNTEFRKVHRKQTNGVDVFGEGASPLAARAHSRMCKQASDAHERNVSKSRTSTPKSKKPERTVASEEVLQRVQLLWIALRGVVRTLTVYFAHMRRRTASSLVQLFLRNLGEWARVKRAMRRLIDTVVLLQRSCRQFTSKKRCRCDVMQRDFQRIEDNYLQTYFRLYAHRAIEEHRAQEEAVTNWISPTGKKIARLESKKGLLMSREETIQFVEQTLDWKRYRVPAAMRKLLIHRYYLAELSKHIDRRRNLVRTVQQTVQFQRDLMQFLKAFGAGEQPHHKDWERPYLESKDVALPEFWHFTEDTVLDMMSMAIEHLLKTPEAQEKFREHPLAKHGKLDEEFDKYCRPVRILEGDIRIVLAAALEQRGLSKSEQASANKKSSFSSVLSGPGHVQGLRRGSHERTSKATKVVAEDSRSDLDEVWRNFTPRLKTMAQEQAAHWAISPNHDAIARDILKDHSLSEKLRMRFPSDTM